MCVYIYICTHAHTYQPLAGFKAWEPDSGLEAQGVQLRGPAPVMP